MINDLAEVAQVELLEIWNYNFDQHGLSHADDYHAFIVGGIAALAAEPNLGDPVEGFPDRRVLLAKRRTRGHGHVAAYRIEADVIRVPHVFHTAQDLRGRLEHE